MARPSPCPGRIGILQDGSLSIVEATWIAQLLSGDPQQWDAAMANITRALGRPPTELDMALWDADGDGVLTGNDALFIAQYMARLRDDFPACSLELVPVAIPPPPPEKKRVSPLPAILGAVGVLGMAALLGSTRRSL